MIRAAALSPAVVLLLALPGPALADSARFPICSGGHRVTCVVDGDTVWLRGEKIRLAGVDAPEISEPRCVAELKRGLAARDRLQAILNSSDWQVIRSGVDRYGRTLAVFRIGGTTAGQLLVSVGLARIWDGRRESWC